MILKEHSQERLIAIILYAAINTFVKNIMFTAVPNCLFRTLCSLPYLTVCSEHYVHYHTKLFVQNIMFTAIPNCLFRTLCLSYLTVRRNKRICITETALCMQ